MQYLTGLVVNRDREEYRRVVLDTENYRNKREDTLVRLARKLASQARASGQSIVLEPMKPYERRVLHATLQNNPYVETHSEGEEPNPPRGHYPQGHGERGGSGLIARDNRPGLFLGRGRFAKGGPMLYRISEVAAMTGLSVGGIRYYEDQGVVTPGPQGGKRVSSLRDGGGLRRQPGHQLSPDGLLSA